jgi:hypothetical protein
VFFMLSKIVLTIAIYEIIKSIAIHLWYKIVK